MKKSEQQYALDAEVRAVLEGHHAWVGRDGFRVMSSNGLGWYKVRISEPVLRHMNGLIHFTCNCASGEHRQHISVPCKHSALVARRLKRQGYARWVDGDWFATTKLLDLLPVVRQT